MDTEEDGPDTGVARVLWRQRQEVAALLLLAVCLFLDITVQFALKQRDITWDIGLAIAMAVYAGGIVGSIWASQLLRAGKGGVMAGAVLGVLFPFCLGTVTFIVVVLCDVKGSRAIVPVLVLVLHGLVVIAYGFALTARARTAYARSFAAKAASRTNQRGAFDNG